MRHLLTFECEEIECAGSLDDAAGETGVLIVTGGREPRIGAHGWQATLARALAEAGYPTLRFDRRGVGDSDGVARDYLESGPDIAAAASCLRRENPAIKRLIGIGNCDAATALALFHRDASLAGVILLNPWLGDADEDALPPTAAIRRRYAERLVSPHAWRRLLTGQIDLRAASRGLMKAAKRPAASSLAGRIATGIAALPAHVLVSEGDATGIAFAAAWRARGVGEACPHVALTMLPTRWHSFAGDGDAERLLAACLSVIRTMTAG